MERISLPLVALLVMAGSARADFITGQVVDSNGVGVPGIDIDVDNTGGGGDPDIFNDGTDPNGFFTTTVPDGIYTVIFVPPSPPTTTHLIKEVEDFVVVGTSDMGVITLPAGVEVSGRVTGPTGFPVSGVDLDVIDEGTGDALTLTGDNTNAFGDFSIAVPASPIEVRFKPGASSPLAQTRRLLNLTQSTDIGDVDLANGWTLTAQVVADGTSTPIAGINFDVRDGITGEELYTPNDNTNGSGNVSIKVPEGAHDIELCPTGASTFAGLRLTGVSIIADLDLGQLGLQTGVVLSGHVQDQGGAPVPGTDLDVNVSPGGLSVFLCGDNANAAGDYSVIVPAGTYDLTFSAPGTFGLAETVVNGVVVNANTVVNATLLPGPFDSFCFGDGGDLAGCTDCQCSNNAPPGSGGGCLNGEGRSARILVSGEPSVMADTLRVEGRDATTSTFAVLISGDNRLPANAANACFGLDSGIPSFALNGLRCVGGNVKRHGARPTDALGDIGATTNGWGTPNGPAGGIIAQGGFSSGQTRSFQIFYREAAEALCGSGQNTTNGVSVTFLP